MFSQACVKNSVHGGGAVCPIACWDTPPGHPSTHIPSRTHMPWTHPPGHTAPLDKHPQIHTPCLRHTPPGHTPLPWTHTPALDTHTLPWTHTPGPTHGQTPPGHIPPGQTTPHLFTVRVHNRTCFCVMINTKGSSSMS